MVGPIHWLITLLHVDPDYNYIMSVYRRIMSYVMKWCYGMCLMWTHGGKVVHVTIWEEGSVLGDCVTYDGSANDLVDGI